MKKFLSLLILVVMVCAMFALPTSAATPKEYEAVYGTPNLDGRLDQAYLQSSQIAINYLYNECQDGNTTDYAHGWAYCLWDDGYLYVYIYVIDDVLSNAKSPTAVCRTDSTEVIIDLANDQVGDETINADAGQFTAGYMESTMAGYGYWYEMYGKDAKFIVRDTDEGYAVEYQIPFGTEYSPAKANWTIGLVLAINDDADGEEGREYIAYTNADQIGCWFKCANYDQLKLVDSASNDRPNPGNEETLPPNIVDTDPVVTNDPSGDDTDPNGGEQSQDPAESNNDPVVTTSKDDTNTAAPSTAKSADNNTEKESGCGSMITSASALLVLGTALVPAVIAVKKKKH